MIERKYTLRPHQADALARVRQRWADGHRKTLLQATVSFGKTLCAAALIADEIDKGGKALFVAPYLSLIDQTVERFWAYGLGRDDAKIGVIQANHPLTKPGRRIQVASAQTLTRREFPANVTLVVVDEVHVQYSYLPQMMANARYADARFVGLSATPWSRELGKTWGKDSLIIASTLKEMADAGWVKPIRYLAPVNIDAKGIKIVAGDYQQGALSERSRGGQVIADTVSAWIQHAKGRPTIAFCVDRAHAQDMQQRFLEAGIKCAYIDANVSAADRAKIGGALATGHCEVVTSVGCLIAGLDWTHVSCALVACKTKSEVKWVQAIGRAVRLHDGIKDALVLDCAGNRHIGHPYDVHRDELDDGDREKHAAVKAVKDKKQAAHLCKCGVVLAREDIVCPSCGEPRPRPKTKVMEGVASFSEIMADGRGGRVSSAPKGDELSEADWYSSLLAIARDRGYKQGWAAVNFKEKFHKWPDRIPYQAREFPHPVVSSWVKSRFIAYKKSRKYSQGRR